VWPFVTGFAALALYEQGRPDAGWQYVQALGQLSMLESRGYTAELFSGDRLKSVDAAVPHQLFATAGFVSGLLRGTIGFDASPLVSGPQSDQLLMRPVLPPGWDHVTVRRLRWGKQTFDMSIVREPAALRITLDVRPGPLPLRIEVPLPAGADPHMVVFEGTVTGRTEVRHALSRPGVAVSPRNPQLVAGAASSHQRVIETRTEGESVLVRLAGPSGSSGLLDVWPASAATGITATGAVTEVVVASEPGGNAVVRVDYPAAATGWTEAQLRFARPKGRSARKP
jgi:hypothetical protein